MIAFATCLLIAAPFAALAALKAPPPAPEPTAQAKRKPRKKPKAKPASVPPKVPMPAGTAAPRGNPLEKQLAEAEAAFEKSGSYLDGQRVLKLKRELRLTKP